MKHKLTVKTSKLLLPILIGIFMVSGTFINLTFIRNNNSFGDSGYEFSEGNAIGPVSASVKSNFVLPVITLRFYLNLVQSMNPMLNPLQNATLIVKDIFRNVLFARAP